MSTQSKRTVLGHNIKVGELMQAGNVLLHSTRLAALADSVPSKGQ